jgi:hypothetical protein
MKPWSYWWPSLPTPRSAIPRAAGIPLDGASAGGRTDRERDCASGVLAEKALRGFTIDFARMKFSLGNEVRAAK